MEKLSTKIPKHNNSSSEEASISISLVENLENIIGRAVQELLKKFSAPKGNPNHRKHVKSQLLHPWAKNE